ncbi:HNH endonuclease [uncultured Granulicatella sp.]|nr:HNH endonuclease [uncultured Granulicatella sp.]
MDELNDMETMQLVPSVVNSKFEHLGGIAEVKKTICFIERKV